MTGRVEKTETYGVARYFLLTMALSFIGWAYETLFVFLQSGRWHDQGFMTMPFCPIYGCSLIGAYLLAGTPDEGRGFLKKVDNRLLRYALYFLIAFTVPTLAELFVGLFFDKAFGIWLWSYRALPLNINGYICLPVSLAWAALIFAFMKWLFPLIKGLIYKIPLKAARSVAILLFALVVVDFIYNFSKI